MTLAASVVYPAASAASALKLSTRWIPVSDDGRRKEAPGLIMTSVFSSSHSSVMTAMSSLWLESSMMWEAQERKGGKTRWVQRAVVN